MALNLQAIENWPASIYNFAGNGVGAAQGPTAANYLVNTGALTLPAAAAGDLLWVDGFTSPFGSAPPDFIAEAVNAEPTVPASLVVAWTGTGTAAPFETLTSNGLTIDLATAAFGGGTLRIGAENVDITTLSATHDDRSGRGTAGGEWSAAVHAAICGRPRRHQRSGDRGHRVVQ